MLSSEPRFQGNEKPVPLNKEEYSRPYHAGATLDNPPLMNSSGNPEPTFFVWVRKDGNAVAIRLEPSLLSEIVGYADPGRKLSVTLSDDPLWYRISNSTISGFIMKRYTQSQAREEELE